MEFQHAAAAGCLMVTVHILGDGHHRGGGLKVGQGQMGGVGFGGGDEAPAPVVPAPDQFRVAGEGSGGGEVLGPVPTPQAVLLTAKGGDAAGGGNSRPGKHGDPGCGGNPIPDLFELRANVRFHHLDHLFSWALPYFPKSRIMNDAGQSILPAPGIEQPVREWRFPWASPGKFGLAV